MSSTHLLALIAKQVSWDLLVKSLAFMESKIPRTAVSAFAIPALLAFHATPNAVATDDMTLTLIFVFVITFQDTGVPCANSLDARATGLASLV